MTSTEIYPSVRSAAFSLKQAVDDLEHAALSQRTHSAILKAWAEHVRQDLKSLMLLADVE